MMYRHNIIMLVNIRFHEIDSAIIVRHYSIIL